MALERPGRTGAKTQHQRGVSRPLVTHAVPVPDSRRPIARWLAARAPFLMLAHDGHTTGRVHTTVLEVTRALSQVDLRPGSGEPDEPRVEVGEPRAVHEDGPVDWYPVGVGEVEVAAPQPPRLGPGPQRAGRVRVELFSGSAAVSSMCHP